MDKKTETVIVGGGQGGLATSYHLMRRGREHVVLEQATQAANAWRNDRWDSFCLVTPNWSFRLPGAEYQGDAPDGFMRRPEIIACFEQYVERFRLPVRFGTRVTSVEQTADAKGYVVRTEADSLEARNVVMATGLFQRPKMPSFSTQLPGAITQLHSGHYRNPRALAPGAVLVVGSAQSGCQIAEELYQNGRRVYLCVGSAGRVPRRYRGRDTYEWMNLSGFLDRTVDQLPSPRARFAPNPQVSGRDGGHALNLHRFARDGVVLLGHLRGASENALFFDADLKQSLAVADKAESDFTRMVDTYIARSGLDAPAENLPALRDGYDAEELSRLDLSSAGITTIIWAMGYSFDFGQVKLPVVDRDGYPIQRRGATDYPGLYFVGLPWLHKAKSGHIFGAGEDADHIASLIAGEGL